MINYTTPVLPIEVDGIDLTGDQDVYVSIEQGRVELEKTGSDLTISYDSQTHISTILVMLTQTESASFSPSRKAYVQVNFINEAGVRGATDIAQIDVLMNLLDREIHYGDQT